MSGLLLRCLGGSGGQGSAREECRQAVRHHKSEAEAGRQKHASKQSIKKKAGSRSSQEAVQVRQAFRQAGR